jgi:hypothetical protein
MMLVICGLLVNIIGGGFIATIFNMDKNLEQLVQKEKQICRDSFSKCGSPAAVNFTLTPVLPIIY